MDICRKHSLKLNEGKYQTTLPKLTIVNPKKNFLVIAIPTQGLAIETVCFHSLLKDYP